jgi:hypothetical protein
MSNTITLDQQITELKAELAIRKNVYRSWIAAGRMNKLTADLKFASMCAALHTLIELQEAMAKAREVQARAPGLTKLCRVRIEFGLDGAPADG